jgi:threonine/homoserine/homoserine lactone efflux protein
MVNPTVGAAPRVLTSKGAGAGADAMTLEAWAAFAATALMLMVMPGPTNLVLVSYGLSLGRAALWPAVLGVTLGRGAALLLALLGAGTLLAAPPPVLAVLKAAGLGYLAWVGVRLWEAGRQAPPALERTGSGPGEDPGASPAAGVGRRRVLRHVCVVTVVNPFNVAYATVLFPHALVRAEQPWAEATVMAATFLGLSLAVALLYGLLAARAHELWGSPRVVLGCNRVGGALLVGLATALALEG